MNTLLKILGVFLIIAAICIIIDKILLIKEKIETMFCLRKNKGRWVIATIDRNWDTHKFEGMTYLCHLKYHHEYHTTSMGSTRALKDALKFETAEMALNYIKTRNQIGDLIIYEIK